MKSINKKKLMMNNIYNHIETTLNSRGFIKNDQKWSLTKQFQQQGQVMIINGQCMEQPSQIIDIEYIVELLGEGYIETVDMPDTREDILYVNFIIKYEEDELNANSFGLYDNDSEYFDIILTSVFKI